MEETHWNHLCGQTVYRRKGCCFLLLFLRLVDHKTVLHPVMSFLTFYAQQCLTVICDEVQRHAEGVVRCLHALHAVLFVVFPSALQPPHQNLPLDLFLLPIDAFAGLNVNSLPPTSEELFESILMNLNEEHII